MNRLQRGTAVALASLVFGAPAIAQSTAQTTSPSTTPTTNAPMTGTGTTGTGTMGTGTMGTTLPGVSTNTPSQRSPDNTTGASPPAVTTSNANRKTAAAPVRGRNSFTMNEARRRIEAGGFSQVTGLKKDQDGIWRGTGMRSGAMVPVYCDYQGNVGAS